MTRREWMLGQLRKAEAHLLAIGHTDPAVIRRQAVETVIRWTPRDGQPGLPFDYGDTLYRWVQASNAVQRRETQEELSEEMDRLWGEMHPGTIPTVQESRA